MAFIRQDFDKYKIIDNTNYDELVKGVEIGLYRIVDSSKKLKLEFVYIGQVQWQTIMERYEQHTNKNGLIRFIIDTLGFENVDKIELKCLKQYKRRESEKVDKEEQDTITKYKVNAFTLKKKNSIIINSQTKQRDIIKALIELRKKELAN